MIKDQSKHTSKPAPKAAPAKSGKAHRELTPDQLTKVVGGIVGPQDNPERKANNT